MKMYNSDQVMQAFKIYQILRTKGNTSKEERDIFLADDVIRSLLEEWAGEEDCTVIVAGQQLYLVPLATYSPYHISNETIKKEYLKSGSTNMDIYLMYFSILVFVGAFYDSFHTTDATRDFISLDEWLNILNEKINTIEQYGEKLKQLEQEYEYNWVGIIEKWTALDDINERAKSQTGRTNSRKNFLIYAKRFLEAQGLVEERGYEELYLTQKAKIIVGRYFMEEEYNRGLLEVIYGYEESVGE